MSQGSSLLHFGVINIVCIKTELHRMKYMNPIKMHQINYSFHNTEATFFLLFDLVKYFSKIHESVPIFLWILALTCVNMMFDFLRSGFVSVKKTHDRDGDVFEYSDWLKLTSHAVIGLTVVSWQFRTVTVTVPIKGSNMNIVYNITLNKVFGTSFMPNHVW